MFGFLVDVTLPARGHAFDASATVPLFEKKSPGDPRALPLERKLAGFALAEQSAGQ